MIESYMESFIAKDRLHVTTEKKVDKRIVFLNVFRDQLDRYGEVDNVTKKWKESLEKVSEETLIILNGDDGNEGEIEWNWNWNSPSDA